MFFHEIETEKLVLKNIDYDDRDFILDQFSNNTINKYLFDAEPLVSLEEADDLISFYTQPEPRMQQRWILILKSNGAEIIPFFGHMNTLLKVLEMFISPNNSILFVSALYICNEPVIPSLIELL